MVDGSLRLPPPLKLVAMTIAEILLIVALKHQKIKSIKSNHLLYNSSTIHLLYNSSTIHLLYNSSTRHLMYNSSTIHLLYNSSTIHLLYNSRTIILSHFLDTKDLL